MKQRIKTADSAPYITRELAADVNTVDITESPYNAVPGSQDNGAIIQSAFTNEPSGTTIFFPPGTYLTSIILDIVDKTLFIVGSGIDETIIQRMGGAGDTDSVIKHRSSQTAAQKITGGGISNLTLHGSNIVDYCLHQTSVNQCVYDSIRLKSPVLFGCRQDCLDAAVGSDPADNQHNVFTNVECECIDTLTSGGFELQGNSTITANTSVNYYENIFCQIRDGDAFFFGDSDANELDFLRVFRPVPNTGRGLVFGAGAAANQHARFNVVLHAETEAAGIEAEGGAHPSEKNWVFYNVDNGGEAIAPVIGVGATLGVATHDMLSGIGGRGFVCVGGAFVSAGASMLTQLAAIVNESLRIHNTASDHMRIVDATNEWAIGIVAGTLRIIPITLTSNFISVPQLLSTGGVRYGAGADTIAAGIIFKSAGYMIVDTQGAAATDDLDTITGGGLGDILILQAANSGRTVVVKQGTGNIKLNLVLGDCSLGNVLDKIQLINDGTNWNEVSRSINGA